MLLHPNTLRLLYRLGDWRRVFQGAPPASPANNTRDCHGNLHHAISIVTQKATLTPTIKRETVYTKECHNYTPGESCAVELDFPRASCAVELESRTVLGFPQNDSTPGESCAVELDFPRASFPPGESCSEDWDYIRLARTSGPPCSS